MNDSKVVAGYYDKMLLAYSMKCTKTFTKIEKEKETVSSKIQAYISEKISEEKDLLKDQRKSLIEEKIMKLKLNLKSLP